VHVNGVPVEWEAEITQVVPYQAIGWKSVSGPKHTGRVTFSPLGNDTLVHVQMNYAPPMRMLRRALAPFSGELEGYIEQVLREFKAGMEKPSHSAGRQAEQLSASVTGTYGPDSDLRAGTQRTRFGAPLTLVEYEAKR